jgi:hypothetical protein
MEKGLCGEGACSRWVAKPPQNFCISKKLGPAAPEASDRSSGSKLPRHGFWVNPDSRSGSGLCLFGCRILRVRATSSCAVTYNYARIRRLVRLGAGLYCCSVAENQRSGLVARLSGASAASCRGLLQPLSYGGHAQGVLGRAGLPGNRSTNLRMATTLRLVARMMAPISYLEFHLCSK